MVRGYSQEFQLALERVAPRPCRFGYWASLSRVVNLESGQSISGDQTSCCGWECGKGSRCLPGMPLVVALGDRLYFVGSVLDSSDRPATGRFAVKLRLARHCAATETFDPGISFETVADPFSGWALINAVARTNEAMDAYLRANPEATAHLVLLMGGQEVGYSQEFKLFRREPRAPTPCRPLLDPVAWAGQVKDAIQRGDWGCVYDLLDPVLASFRVNLIISSVDVEFRLADTLLILLALWKLPAFFRGIIRWRWADTIAYAARLLSDADKAILRRVGIRYKGLFVIALWHGIPILIDATGVLFAVPVNVINEMIERGERYYFRLWIENRAVAEVVAEPEILRRLGWPYQKLVDWLAERLKDP